MKNYLAIAHAKLKAAVPWGEKLPGWNSMVGMDKRGSEKGKVDKVALKEAQAAAAKQRADFIANANAEIDALLPKVSPQVLGVIGQKPEKKETHSDEVYATHLSIFCEKLKDAVAAGPAVPVTASAPTLKVETPKVSAPTASVSAPVAPKVTAEGLGRTVNALMTNPDPAVRTPIVQGLQKSIEAAAKPRPDFSFLKGMERTQISMEFDSLGGLSESTHALYMLRRRQYCEKHHLTPEQVSGATSVVIPEKITRAEHAQREERQRAQETLPRWINAFNDVNAKIVAESQSKPGSFNPANRTAEAQSLLAKRTEIMARMNACEKALGKPLTK